MVTCYKPPTWCTPALEEMVSHGFLDQITPGISSGRRRGCERKHNCEVKDGSHLEGNMGTQNQYFDDTNKLFDDDAPFLTSTHHKSA